MLPLPCAGAAATVQLYAKDGATGALIRGEKVPADGAWHDLSLALPGGSAGYIQEVGVILAPGTGSGDLVAYLDDLMVDGAPDYRLDFSHMALDVWPGGHREVPQFGRLKGHTYLDGPWLSLSCADFGEMYTGHHSWGDYTVSATLKPLTGERAYVNLRVQGAMRSYAAGFSGAGKVALRKNQHGYTTLCEAAFPWQPGQEYRLDFTARGGRLTLAIDGQELLSYEDPEPLRTGCAGLSVEDGSHCLYRDLAITGGGDA